MSHIVKLETTMTDTALLAKAAARIEGATVVGEGTHVLYSGRPKGFAVQLPGWKFPVVVNAGGQVTYDNYGGHWGDPAHLRALTQAYSVEKTRAVLKARGAIVTGEKKLANGTVRLVVQGR